MGLYILDEPEAALSPKRQIQMLSLMHELIRRGSQFIIATHSPILLAYPDATIYEIQEDGFKQLNYEQTQTFRVSSDFLANYKEIVADIVEY